MQRQQDSQKAAPDVPVEVVRELLHDLGGPLVAAQGFLSLLERTPTGESARRYAASLHESLDHMKALLDHTKATYCRRANTP
jgi:signal transduction histidine kinase